MALFGKEPESADGTVHRLNVGDPPIVDALGHAYILQGAGQLFVDGALDHSLTAMLFSRIAYTGRMIWGAGVDGHWHSRDRHGVWSDPIVNSPLWWESIAQLSAKLDQVLAGEATLGGLIQTTGSGALLAAIQASQAAILAQLAADQSQVMAALNTIIAAVTVNRATTIELDLARAETRMQPVPSDPGP